MVEEVLNIERLISALCYQKIKKLVLCVLLLYLLYGLYII